MVGYAHRTSTNAPLTGRRRSVGLVATCDSGAHYEWYENTVGASSTVVPTSSSAASEEPALSDPPNLESIPCSHSEVLSC
jgi:hypothetical protein